MLLKGPGRQGAPRACSLNHFLAKERGCEPLALAVGESGPSHAVSPGDPPDTSPPRAPGAARNRPLLPGAFPRAGAVSAGSSSQLKANGLELAPDPCWEEEKTKKVQGATRG